MISVGAKLRWNEGKILYPSYMWRSPSKRRIPRLLIEDRALAVGILIYIQEGWVIFRETDLPSGAIDLQESEKLEVYARRYHLLPERLRRQDSFDWISKEGNAALFWGKDNHYFVKPFKR